MVLIPVFVSLLFYQNFVLALAVFVLAGVTDGLDGLLARRFNQKSQLGTILDPIADKLLLVTSFVVLSMRSVFSATFAVSSADSVLGDGRGHQPRRFHPRRSRGHQRGHRFSWIPALNARQSQYGRSDRSHCGDNLRGALSLRHRLVPADDLHDRFRLLSTFRRPLRLFRLQTRQRRPPLRIKHTQLKW